MASSMDLLIFGHRGYAARRVENTISAFELAGETDGIAGVELDVQVARDGEIVVAHDGDLQRLADDPRRIVEVTSAELATMALHARGRGETDAAETELTTVGIPTLNTVLDTLPSWMSVDIELKSYDDTPRDLPERLAELIADRKRAGVSTPPPGGVVGAGVPDTLGAAGTAGTPADLSRRVIVSSFDPRLVRRFRRAMRRQPSTTDPVSTAVIYSGDREVPWFLRSGLGVAFTRSEVAKPSWKTALGEEQRGRGGDRGSLRRHHPPGSAGVPLYVWTVNDQDVLRRLMMRDVVGVIGDDPADLVAWATAIAARSGEPDGDQRPETRSE